MTARITAVVSAVSHRRIGLARDWLAGRSPAEEILIVAPNRDAANELACDALKAKGAAFGWHRLTFAQLAVSIAKPF
jgi:hypothetical protein